MPSSLAHKTLTLSLFLHHVNVLDLIVVPLVAAEEARGALVGPGTLRREQRGRVGNAEKNWVLGRDVVGLPSDGSLRPYPISRQMQHQESNHHYIRPR